MDYEKKYKEALERAKQHKNAFVRDVIGEIFHEFKESEDEKVKRILHSISIKMSSHLRDIFTDEEFQCFDAWSNAWLEKQGEQKLTPIFRIGDTIIAKDGTYIEKEPFHIDMIEDDCYWDGENTILVCNQDKFEIFNQNLADKVEPKFHEGDWVVYDGWTTQIKEVYEDGYSNIHQGFIPKKREEEMRLWTIQDAKDGDVLFCKGNIKHSNGIKYERICLFNNLDNAFFTLTKTSNYVEDYDIDVNIDYPDNTVPATKEQKEILFMAMADAGYTFDFKKKELKKIEQKFSWSEEDEEMHRKCICAMRASACGFPEEEKFVEQVDNWLKSLKDKVQPQPKQEWSEEDESRMDNMCHFLEEYGNQYYGYLTLQGTISWLKSLRPQSQWKPSIAQLNALSIVSKGNAPDDIEAIVSLYQDLKKLKG